MASSIADLTSIICIPGPELLTNEPLGVAARLSISKHASRMMKRGAVGVVALALSMAPKMLPAAEDPHVASAPLPPQRPTTLSAPAAAAPANATLPASSSAPPQNAGAAQASPPKPADEPIRVGVYNEGPGTMLRLPPASHARMHQCAVEWQNMKTTGAAVEKTWFNFALQCLTR
jgi:hypothetical protein